jgi:hypothetical protein
LYPLPYPAARLQSRLITPVPGRHFSAGRPPRTTADHPTLWSAKWLNSRPPLTATARPQRTKVDWALEMARLLDTWYKRVRKVVLICDNLNTHTKGAFYEAFTPSKARSYVKRIDFRYTPKHGSWLNIAENELSSLTRQCVSGRRFESIGKLQTEIKHWSDHSNEKQRGVDWQFKVKDARKKLKSLYPKSKT